MPVKIARGTTEQADYKITLPCAQKRDITVMDKVLHAGSSMLLPAIFLWSFEVPYFNSGKESPTN